MKTRWWPNTRPGPCDACEASSDDSDGLPQNDAAIISWSGNARYPPEVRFTGRNYTSAACTDSLNPRCLIISDVARLLHSTRVRSKAQYWICRCETGHRKPGLFA